MEAALETQGALLESKGLALEKTKLQLDREREKTVLLEQKIAKMEADFEQLRQEQAQSLWATVAAEGPADNALTTEKTGVYSLAEIAEATGQNQVKPEPVVPSAGQAAAAEAAEAAMRSLSELAEAKDREIETLTGNWEQLREQFAELQAQCEEQQSRLRAMEADNTWLDDLRGKLARAQRELDDQHAAELALREELERYRAKLAIAESSADLGKTTEEDAQKRIRAIEDAQRARIETLESEHRERISRLEEELRKANGLRETIAQYQREAEGHFELESKLREELNGQLAANEARESELRARVASLEAEAARSASIGDAIAQYQRELAEQEAVARSLREEIERQRKSLEMREEDSAKTQEIDRSLISRMAGAEAELNEKRTELQRKEEELNERFAARERALEAAEMQQLEKEDEISRQLEAKAQELADAEANDREKQEEIGRQYESRIRELETLVAQARDKEEELSRQYEAKARELQAALEAVRGESQAARVEVELNRAETQVETGVAALQEQESALRMRIEQLRADLLQKENQRLELEEGRLTAIQQKLEEIGGELRGMERLFSTSGATAGNGVEAVLQRLEKLLQEQEQHLLSVLGAPVESGYSAAAQELAERIAALEAELASEKRAWLELTRSRGPGPIAPASPVRARAADGGEAGRAVAEKEQVIDELRRQLREATSRLDPELTGPDNLQLIHGVGPYTKKILRDEFGITTFKQVAALTGEDIARISERLFFRGRIQREDWLGQAVALHFKKYNELVEIPDPPYPLKWAA
jgi:predicted flap endonuclease-1-like 5' DNA nuclease/DNA repair exonuclease SbcCD ATPase subunit